MDDQKQKAESAGIAPQLDEKKKQGSTELSDAELNDVAGGKVAHADMQIQKYLDKSSP
jgi:type VI protein secretion system component Hcp